MLVLVVSGLLAISVVLGKLPPGMVVLYIAMSLLTYFFYYLDKSAARNGGWRRKESTLHTLGLLGGWPGALLARHRLRHKTRKQPFRFIFWLTVFTNLGALCWLHTAEGAGYLRAALGDHFNFPLTALDAA